MDIKLVAQRIKDVLIDIDAGVYDHCDASLMMKHRNDLDALVTYIIDNCSDCSDCNGTRLRKCTECNGRGWFGYSEWTIESWCEHCSRTGSVPCGRCR